MSGTRIVSVQLDIAVRERLRDFAARTSSTHGAVVLRAIEAHAEELSAHWTRPASSSTLTRLFPDTPAPRHREQATTQTQVRISPAAADVLDGLVSQWKAPSRSALINEALRRYLSQHQGTP